MNLSPSAIEQTYPSKWNGKTSKTFLAAGKVERYSLFNSAEN